MTTPGKTTGRFHSTIPGRRDLNGGARNYEPLEGQDLGLAPYLRSPSLLESPRLSSSLYDYVTRQRVPPVCPDVQEDWIDRRRRRSIGV